jgi:hypothetical protein
MFERIRQLAKSSDHLSGGRSHRRKKTWVAETFVRCKNNPQQTTTSLSIDPGIAGRHLRTAKRYIFTIPSRALAPECLLSGEQRKTFACGEYFAFW